MGAVLTDVGGHQPAKPVPGLAVLGLAVLGLAVLGLAVLGLAVLGLAVLAGRRRDRPALLDERHVPPGVGAEADRVVVRHPGQYQAVVGNAVPLLAGHLARLAADAHRCVGEETHPRRRIVIAAGGGLVGHVHTSMPVCLVMPARRWYSRTRSSRACPRGRRPGRMSQANALASWMCTLGSRLRPTRSLAESPVDSPLLPQW